MGVLASDLFKDDPRLEACATNPAKHLLIGTAPGTHIGKIHEALKRLDPGGPAIDQTELDHMVYGPTTANRVFHYKDSHTPKIINTAYQHSVDKIVGIMTITTMDTELSGVPVSRNDIVDRAFNDSRAALRDCLTRLRGLRDAISNLPAGSDPAFGNAMAKLIFQFKRDISVVSRRLLMSADPTSSDFRDNLAKVIRMCEINLGEKKTLLAAGRTGLCDPTNPRNAKGLPHAWTLASQPDPKTHLCEPFFTGDSRDLQRDVVTHEFFHLQGLVDTSVNNTSDALRNANTIAQIVAFTADRFRQRNSDGNEPAVPPLPSP
jgi:hypothetical protein